MCKETAFFGNPKKRCFNDHSSQHVSAIFLPQLNLLDAIFNDQKTEEDWGEWNFNMVSKHGNKFSAVPFCQKNIIESSGRTRRENAQQTFVILCNSSLKTLFNKFQETDIFFESCRKFISRKVLRQISDSQQVNSFFLALNLSKSQVGCYILVVDRR